MIFQPMPDRSRVQFTTNSDPVYRVVDSGDPRRIVLEIDGTELSPAVQSTLDLSRLERELTRVDVSGENVDGKPMVRITAQLSRGVPFRVTPGEGGIYLDVDRGADTVTPLAATEGPRKRATAQIRYGTKLSLDFVDADVGDILRLISDVSGINFVSGDEVNGKVSVRLIDVPWETALETILMTNNPLLAQVPVADNIIRITTEDKLLHEEEKRQKKKELERRTLEASKELEPLVMREIPISYAQIGEKGKLADGKGTLMDIAYGFTSPRIEQDGLFKADPRTNTLIVKDLQSNVDEIERVVRKLDTPTPAVIVEARIVEVGDGVAESLGIRWNARFNADPAHGNALPVAFPNSLAVEGAQTDPNEPGNFMVNLPASNSTAAVGISFGHIASTLSLDMQLSAMENMGKTKILSTPKILVVQNEKASINIGDRLPVPQTDAEGNRTVEFLRTGILLEVTPQVTNDGRVFMDILIEKSSPGATVITTDGPMFSIETRDATTKVLIGDGETAVIGGILEQFSDDTRNSVPHLSKIPGLGWLFRSKSTTETRTELMIFLTPRIIPSG
ncbi:type IV pilus secretin PilQ [Candidatus Moduliflexota bacterium]